MFRMRSPNTGFEAWTKAVIGGPSLRNLRQVFASNEQKCIGHHLRSALETDPEASVPRQSSRSLRGFNEICQES